MEEVFYCKKKKKEEKKNLEAGLKRKRQKMKLLHLFCFFVLCEVKNCAFVKLQLQNRHSCSFRRWSSAFHSAGPYLLSKQGQGSLILRKVQTPMYAREDKDIEGPKKWIVQRRDGNDGIFPFLSSTLLRSPETGELSSIAVLDGELVIEVEDESADQEFVLVRTIRDEVGLLRKAYICHPSEYMNWISRLQERANRSARRRQDAEAIAALSWEQLRDALRPLELILGEGSLLDTETEKPNFNGNVVILIATALPLYAAVVVSDFMKALETKVWGL